MSNAPHWKVIGPQTVGMSVDLPVNDAENKQFSSSHQYFFSMLW